MFEVNLKEAKEIAKMAIENKQSSIFMGTPGIGKTEILEQIANDIGFGFLCFEASSLDPTDVRGVLIPHNGSSYFTKSALLPDVKKHGERGILLVDELPSGLPAVQVSLHPLFHPKERRLGSDKIPDGWIPMATGNYAQDGAGAYSLLTALSDRVCIINVIEDYQVWKEDYAFPNNIHPITIGFLNFRPDLFSTFAKRNKSEKGKTFASPRTHTAVSKVLYYADKANMPDKILHAALAGYVGDGVSAEYMAFRKTYKELPDPKDIVEKNKNIIPEEPSILYALCSAIIAYIKEAQMPVQKAVDRILEYSTKIDTEFGGLLIRDAYITYRNNILKSKHWVTVAQRYF